MLLVLLKGNLHKIKKGYFNKKNILKFLLKCCKKFLTLNKTYSSINECVMQKRLYKKLDKKIN